MRNELIFHPILFSFLPILFLFQYNIHEVPLTDISIPLILSVIPVFVIWIPIKIITDYRKSALITSTLILLFIVYTNIRNILADQQDLVFQIFGKNSILGPIFVVLGVFIIIIILKRNSVKNLNRPLNIMAVTIVVFLIFNIGSYYITNPVDYTISEYSDLEIPIFESDTKPDIYMFILDEFPGKNTLRIDFDYNLENFEKNLNERGFVTPSQSYSNYADTAFSTPSFMNMIYLDFLVDELGVDSNDIHLPDRMRQENIVMKILKANDYNITTFYGGMGIVPNVHLIDEYLCKFGTINPDLRDNFVLTYMPFNYFTEMFLKTHQYEKLECVFDTINNNKFQQAEPKFVHAHLRLPHYHYIYDEHGNRMFDKEDGDKVAFLQQTKFAEKKIIELVDSIQARSPDSIIIIISDHGFRGEIDWKRSNTQDHMRGFNVISAFYFPEHSDKIPSEISLVNIFRILFNSYFNTDYEILEDRHIWYSHPFPYVQSDVGNAFKDL